jgi:DNA-binding NarL/FixJ family response regulator
MIAVAILSADPLLRRGLAQVLSTDADITVAGVVDDLPALLRLLDGAAVGVIVADAPPREVLADWCARQHGGRCVVLCDAIEPEDAVALLQAGAAAVMLRAAPPEEIVAAVKAAASGLAVLPRALLPPLLDGPLSEAAPGHEGAPLTPRELEVLAAMADGASNKAIARALGISFHTAKFHVAAILAKLDADSRTEAVAKAAQRGLVML